VDTDHTARRNDPADHQLLQAASQQSRIMNTARRRWLVLIVCAVLSACTPSAAPLPTVSSFEMAQTAQVQTQNAPPTGFNVVTFPLIDAHLSDQPAWYAALTITFDGVFAADQQKTTGTLNAQIYRNELTTGRRVLFKANGSLALPMNARWKASG